MSLFRIIWKNALILTFMFLVMILCLQASAVCNYSDNQNANTHGFLKITGVSVNRINLALKEIDIEITIADVEINGPFNITVWAPFRYGGSPTYVGNGTLNSAPWYEWRRSQWKWFRDVSIRTANIGELNCFPFEKYQTEIVFGFSSTNMSANVRDAYLSWELEQYGYWSVKAWAVNTSQAKISSLNATYSRSIRDYRVKAFVSLIVQLEHPEGYRWKMFLPVWGPMIFTLFVFFVQFSRLRKKMQRRDHISMFVAIAIFTLGNSLVIREMTPPELTFPELLNFIIVILYSVTLFMTIYRGSHKNGDNDGGEERCEKRKKEQPDEINILDEKKRVQYMKIKDYYLTYLACCYGAFITIFIGILAVPVLPISNLILKLVTVCGFWFVGGYYLAQIIYTYGQLKVIFGYLEVDEVISEDVKKLGFPFDLLERAFKYTRKPIYGRANIKYFVIGLGYLGFLGISIIACLNL